MDVIPGKRIASHWKYGVNIGGNLQLTGEVDRKVAEAITYLESIHDTNRCGIPTLEEMIEGVEKSKGGR